MHSEDICITCYTWCKVWVCHRQPLYYFHYGSVTLYSYIYIYKYATGSRQIKMVAGREDFNKQRFILAKMESGLRWVFILQHCIFAFAAILKKIPCILAKFQPHFYLSNRYNIFASNLGWGAAAPWVFYPNYLFPNLFAQSIEWYIWSMRIN